MRKLLIGLTVAASLVFAAPAMAWDQKECDDWYKQHGTPHEDCQAPPKPPEQPPVAPPVTPPAPPVAPPVTPPVVPPAPPSAPEYEVPDVPASPDLPKREQGKTEKRQGTQGKAEKRRTHSAAPQAQTREVSTSTETGTLPYTGIPAGLAALLGAGLAAAGAAMRRRVR